MQKIFTNQDFVWEEILTSRSFDKALEKKLLEILSQVNFQSKTFEKALYSNVLEVKISNLFVIISICISFLYLNLFIFSRTEFQMLTQNIDILVVETFTILPFLVNSGQLKRLPRNTASKVYVFGVILVRIFLHSNWIRRDTEYLSVFSHNVGKCRPE